MSLPKGFKRLEYIQSSGTQYVNTLFSPNQNTKLEVCYQTTQSSACGIAVVDQSWQNNGFGVWGNAAVYGNSVYNSVVFYGDDPITMILDKGQLYKNGELVWTGTEATFQTPSNLTLMALNRNGSMAEYTSGKLYYCKLWDNDELVRDFIPCQNASEAVGLWDAVNAVFYGNAGTGTFTAGPVVPEIVDESEITELEYIQSSGTQYFNTGFLPSSRSRVVMDFESLVSGVDMGLCGARTSNVSKAFCFWFYTNYITSARFDYSKVNSITTAVPRSNERITLDMNQNTCVCDNFSETQPIATFQCDYDLALFGINTAGTVGTLFTGKMYFSQIYDNGLLERDYIPAMLSSGEVGLYDRVFHEFYRNAGTGEFIAGPEMEHEDYAELEYIESNGSQYLDSLFVPNQNSRVDVLAIPLSIADTANGSGFIPYGAATSYNSNAFECYTSNGQYEFNYDGQYGFVGSPVVGEKVEISQNKNSVVLETEGSVALSYDFNYQTFTAPYSLTLFGIHRETALCGLQRILECQIYDNGTEVRSYIPVLHPSGVTGLWDSVNERFYASATTTDFIAGPEAHTVPKAPSNFRVKASTGKQITLTWNPMEEVLGYRLYRQGQLLADTTETSVSVAVEPFAGAVFTVTAYNENGEGAGATLTHYNIPANPLLYLITDRTQQDVTERNPKGYYAASDLNRVGYAMDYLANIIRGYGYTLEVHTKTDWTDEDWKLTGEMVQYLQSLNNLKSVFSTLVELPESMERIDYQDANNIELLLLTIDETVARVVAGFTRANAFALRSGAKGLPVSQSDRGRNWGHLDAMETTWANWQLATWYLLLYGNLKAEGVVE